MILDRFFGRPGEKVHVRELARMLGAAPSAVGRELDMLERSGILASRIHGRTRLYAVDDDSPIARDARALFRKLHGVEARLTEALSRVPAIEEALLYGSYVDGTEGPDSDIDVLVIGRPHPAALSIALSPVEEELGRPIHTTTISRRDFDARSKRPGFVSEIMERPHISLVAATGPR